MDFTQELNMLVKIVKNNAKKNERKITNEFIADKLGITRTYLSDMLSGKKPTQEYHITDFKLRLQNELATLTPDRALITAMLDDYAALKSSLVPGTNKEEIINEIERKADAKLNDFHKP